MMSRNYPPASAASLIEILRSRADSGPDAVAFLYLIDGEEEGPRLTYAALDQQARAIAAVLRDGAESGDRALLLYEPGLDFISALFGCWYAGIVPVPAYPPRRGRQARHWETVSAIALDCQPRLVLTTANLAAGLAIDSPFQAPRARPGSPDPAPEIDRRSPSLPDAGRPSVALSAGSGDPRQAQDPRQARWIATDQIDASQTGRWREPRVESNALALLQYTSGSTAAPKGVMVSHANLMHNESLIQMAMEHPRPGCGVCWLPLYHDMGLIGFVLQTVFRGGRTVLLSASVLVQRPYRWLQAISRYRPYISGGPNFAYDLCVQRVTAEQKATLDLSDWTIAFVGAEPVSAVTLESFAEAFAACGFRREAFYPCYGLAEATLFVTGGMTATQPVIRCVSAESLEQGQVSAASLGETGMRALVGCGHTWGEQEVAIVHPDERTRCPDGTVGEIWVRGPSVAQGYWNRPEETEYTFRARVQDADQGSYLRTGDLGFVHDGELFVTGRLKDLLIIHGRNHYPQDIEATVQAMHPALRVGGGAAIECGPDGQPCLVIVQELDPRQGRGLDLVKLRGDIRQAVAARHELRVHDVLFLEPGTLPRTSSGKVRRHACRAGYELGTLCQWRER